MELKAERDKLRRRLQAIDQILGDEEENYSLPLAVRNVTRHIGGNGNGTERLGIREAARRVLADSAPNGLRPKQVVEAMEAIGYKDSDEATTSLITRVRNELWRMANRKELRSLGGGAYTIGGDT